MSEKNVQSHKDESKLEFFIHNYWAPEWHYAKVKMYVHHLENIDNFTKDVLQMMELDEDAKNMIKDLLMLEIIASTMFIAESFAGIMGACYTNPKNIQKHLKEFDATKFYSNISSNTDDEYCARILSLPQLKSITGAGKKEIMKSIKDFREELIKIKEYYFSHLDLFNSYKHGFRIFPIQSFGEDDKPFNVILYFSKNHKENVVTITRMDRDHHKHQELANDMIYLIRIVLENHKAKLESPDKWRMTIPIRRIK